MSGHHAVLSVETLIVGSGFSGLGMAIQLKKEGRHDFVVLEKAAGLGGTWRENNYPGCACDVPSHLYSFSFEPNPSWSRMFAPQSEILKYLQHCADKYGITQHLRFNSEVVHAAYDASTCHWTVQTREAVTYKTRFLVFGLGALSRPATPQLPGLPRFKGRTFHSAEWDHSFDLTGKRVAVVGTGASAIQFVPEIAKQVAHLDLYQRTPPWVVPKPDRLMSLFEQRSFRAAPAMQRAYRYAIYSLMELQAVGFTLEPRVMKLAAALGKRHLRSQVKDDTLRARLTPTYIPGCKRILMSNSYYPALASSHVEVVSDGITEVTEQGVITKRGQERAVDAIIFGTGFRVTDLLTPMTVIGEQGRDLNQVWAERVEAFLGTTVSGFPNLFMLMGPNTGLGHNSMVFMIEAQVNYALRCMDAVQKRGAGALDVAKNTQDAFNQRVMKRLRRSVWSTGCQSWYLDDRGYNPTVWPGFTFEFWLKTRRITATDYRFIQS